MGQTGNTFEVLIKTITLDQVLLSIEKNMKKLFSKSSMKLFNNSITPKNSIKLSNYGNKENFDLIKVKKKETKTEDGYSPILRKRNF